MANPISKAVNESMNQEIDTFDYDSVNVDLVTIESDMKKGNYGSFTKALTTLDNGKTLVVSKLKNLYPKIQKDTKNPLEVKALSLIEESFIKDKIEIEKKRGTYDSIIGYWYLDSEISKKSKKPAAENSSICCSDCSAVIPAGPRNSSNDRRKPKLNLDPTALRIASPISKTIRQRFSIEPP